MDALAYYDGNHLLQPCPWERRERERELELELEREPVKRTSVQNAALHKGFSLLAEALNDAGYEMKAVLAVKEVDVSWTKESVKEVLFRPIMSAMTEKGSTTELGKVEVSEVWDVLNRHLGENFGVTVGFPSEEE